jgi:hypothetical protein
VQKVDYVIILYYILYHNNVRSVIKLRLCDRLFILEIHNLGIERENV